MCDLTLKNDSPINQSERKCPVRLYIFLALFLLAYGDVGYAASVPIAWDANPEQDLAGYKVYKRILPSLDYGSPVFSGMPSIPSAPQTTITNLAEESSYGFIVTAFDSSGNESGPSIEIQITIISSGSAAGENTIVWRDTSTGDVGVWLMDGLSAPTTGVIAEAVEAAWVIAGVGDLDGDGKADLVWRNTSTGDVGYWLMDGLSAPTTGVFAGSVPLEWEIQP